MKRQTILIKEFEHFYDAIDYTHSINYEEIIKGYNISSFEMTITYCVCVWVVEIKARKEVKR